MPLTPRREANRFHPIPITAINRETIDAISVDLAIPPALKPSFAFRPGQYLTLRTTIGGEEIRRSYSICSALDDPTLRVAIKRVEGGRFSTWAHDDLAPGQTLDIQPPAGRFTLPPNQTAQQTAQQTAGKTYLAVAAGSGITPILSILKSTLAQEPQSRFILLYGSRRTADILFRDDLEALKDRFLTRLAITHILSREQQDIPILNGRLDGAKVLTLLANTRPHTALLCGPNPMIASVTTALETAGLEPGQILSERFFIEGAPTPHHPKPPGTTAPAFATATIIADGIRTPIPIDPGETILTAALRAGLDLPYSCRGGMCSTCRARITEGQVRMDVNYSLEPWETAAGYVLTCQSHPLTPTVTVDYDHV